MTSSAPGSCANLSLPNSTRILSTLTPQPLSCAEEPHSPCSPPRSRVPPAQDRTAGYTNGSTYDYVVTRFSANAYPLLRGSGLPFVCGRNTTANTTNLPTDWSTWNATFYLTEKARALAARS